MVYVGLFLVVLIDHAMRLLLPDWFGLQYAPPSLALLTALYIGFRSKRTGQLGYAVLLGVMADALSSHGVGHFAFLFGVGAYIASRIRRYLPPDASIAIVVAVFFCSVVMASFALLIAVVHANGHIGAGFARSVVQALANAALAPLFYPVLDQSRLFRKALGGRDYQFA
jgi:rod shape-determining protein MreD